MSKKKNKTKFDRLWNKYKRYLETTQNPISFIEFRWGTNPNYYQLIQIDNFIKDKGWILNSIKQ